VAHFKTRNIVRGESAMRMLPLIPAWHGEVVRQATTAQWARAKNAVCVFAPYLTGTK
jgi:hypothetical protein